MTKPIEIKQVVHQGTRYTCTIKSVILANGKAGASWLDSARGPDGLVTDDALLSILRRLLGLA